MKVSLSHTEVNGFSSGPWATVDGVLGVPHAGREAEELRGVNSDPAELLGGVQEDPAKKYGREVGRPKLQGHR